MSIREIIRVPNPFLKIVAKPVSIINDSILGILDDMLETMYNANGIGLAATQISEDKRLIVMDCGKVDFNEDDMTETKENEPINAYITLTDPKSLNGSDIVFYDDETMEQMTYKQIDENDDNWIILNKDRETTSYKQ